MRRHGTARRAPDRGMNRLEADWAWELEVRKRAGEIRRYDYEPLKLRMARATFYTPDFLVVTAEGKLELHEVKGHWEDDARVKVKVAARLFPEFRFLAVRRGRRGEPWWKVEEF